MRFRSLKLRLMALALAWVVASLVAAAVILQVLFVTNLERNVRAELDGALTRLVGLIDLSQGQLDVTAPMPDPRYDTPLGGRYWQVEVPATGEIKRSRSLWDLTIETDGRGLGLYHQTEPNAVHLIILSRGVRIGDTSIRVTAAEDHAPIHEAGMVFAWDVTRLFVLLGAVIIAAAWLQLWLGFSPLNRLRQAIDDVRRGRQQRLSGRFPDEVLPLIEEVNGLLEEREANTERARQRASDLAHGLKTPLAAIQGIALRVRDKGNAADADLIEDLAFEMSRRVDYQMRLATLRLRGDHRESTSLNTALLRTITVLKKTGGGSGLHWVAELAPDCQVDIHRQDLMELVGVMLENAAKWASSRVVVRSARHDSEMLVEICDDGPGIPQERLAQLGGRGQRLDESSPGTGLGLAIAGEILALNGGRASYGKADIGGLAVSITLPLSCR